MTATRPIPTLSSSSTAQLGALLSARQRLTYVVILGALTALGPFTVDLYLPAMPSLQSELGVGTSAIQLTLAGTTIGFAVGQLLIGPLSDKVGRKGPLIFATLLHVAACVGAAMAPDILWLCIFRVMQGFGAAAGGVVAMAMVRDMLVSGLAPVIAPVIGSQLLLFTDWRGLFWSLAVYGVVVVICVALFIVETLPESRRHQTGHSTMSDRYRSLFSDRVFVGAILLGGMNFTGLFAYLTTSSFLFQDVFGFSAQQFGLLFAVNSIGVVVGVQVSSRLMRNGIGPQWILAVTTVVQLAMAITILVLADQHAGFWGTAIPLWFYIAACGFSFPAIQVLALANHGAEAGTAASLLGAVNFGLAGLVAPLIGLLGVASAVPMGLVMGATAIVAIFVLWSVVRPSTVPALSD